MSIVGSSTYNKHHVNSINSNMSRSFIFAHPSLLPKGETYEFDQKYSKDREGHCTFSLPPYLILPSFYIVLYLVIFNILLHSSSWTWLPLLDLDICRFSPKLYPNLVLDYLINHNFSVMIVFHNSYIVYLGLDGDELPMIIFFIVYLRLDKHTTLSYK